VQPVDPAGPGVSLAVEHLVLTLPPKERACVLLKDVFDYSLDEIAVLVGSTSGGVKSALKRGRTKLPVVPTGPSRRRPAYSQEAARLRDLYIERFNRRDWDGLCELIADDAQVRVADRYVGPVRGAPYFGRYDRLTTPWRLAPGEVDGEQVVLVLERGADAWTPHAVVRLEYSTQRIVRIVDYTHCPWVLSAAVFVGSGDSWADARRPISASRA
jgi:RNA polymerase sigma-70 factor, ECF subfamily